MGVVVLIVVGPDKLPQFARTAGKWYGQIRRTADEMRRALVLEADRQDAEQRYEEMMERRRRAEEERRRATEANPGVAAQDEALPGTRAPDAESLDDDLGHVDADEDPGEVHRAPAPALGHGHGHQADPHVDDELDALINDPNGPYAAGTPAASLAARHDASEPDAEPAHAPATGPSLPPGVTAEEWAELPEHIRQMLRERSGDDAGRSG